MWIYDEDGFPSGAAGGQVLADYPEGEALGLYYSFQFVDRGGRERGGRILRRRRTRRADAQQQERDEQSAAPPWHCPKTAPLGAFVPPCVRALIRSADHVSS